MAARLVRGQRPRCGRALTAVVLGLALLAAFWAGQEARPAQAYVTDGGNGGVSVLIAEGKSGFDEFTLRTYHIDGWVSGSRDDLYLGTAEYKSNYHASSTLEYASFIDGTAIALFYINGSDQPVRITGETCAATGGIPCGTVLPDVFPCNSSIRSSAAAVSGIWIYYICNQTNRLYRSALPTRLNGNTLKAAQDLYFPIPARSGSDRRMAVDGEAIWLRNAGIFYRIPLSAMSEALDIDTDPRVRKWSDAPYITGTMPHLNGAVALAAAGNEGVIAVTTGSDYTEGDSSRSLYLLRYDAAEGTLSAVKLDQGWNEHSRAYAAPRQLSHRPFTADRPNISGVNITSGEYDQGEGLDYRASVKWRGVAGANGYELERGDGPLIYTTAAQSEYEYEVYGTAAGPPANDRVRIRAVLSADSAEINSSTASGPFTAAAWTTYYSEWSDPFDVLYTSADYKLDDRLAGNFPSSIAPEQAAVEVAEIIGNVLGVGPAAAAAFMPLLLLALAAAVPGMMIAAAPKSAIMLSAALLLFGAVWVYGGWRWLGLPLPMLGLPVLVVTAMGFMILKNRAT